MNDNGGDEGEVKGTSGSTTIAFVNEQPLTSLREGEIRRIAKASTKLRARLVIGWKMTGKTSTGSII